MTDKLLKILEEKINLINDKKENEDAKLEEIKKLQTIIKSLKENPFSLYELDENSANYIVDSLSLGEDYIATVKKYKVIYDGFLQFGRDAIPQIEVVENFIEETRKKLDARKFSLSDEVADHQYTIIQLEEHNKLYEELTDSKIAVSKLDLLFKILSESTLDVKEKNSLLFEINSKNNSIFEEHILNDVPSSKNEKSEYEGMIESIQEKLKTEFYPATLNNLKSISELISNCKTKEDFETIIEEWKFSFGDENFSKIVEGIIMLKNIELLTVKEIAGDDVSEYVEDLSNLDMQIGFLEEYKNGILTANTLEKESGIVDISVNKVEQALMEYNDNPLVSKNCVLFISEGLDRDIKSIDDKETLEDVFLLIEQLKNDKVESRGRITDKKDLELLKPKSKGRQARVVFTKLDDNIYGIINISGKKADNPRGWVNTIEYRRKNCDIDNLKKTIKNPDVLSYYITRTKEISNRLKK